VNSLVSCGQITAVQLAETYARTQTIKNLGTRRRLNSLFDPKARTWVITWSPLAGPQIRTFLHLSSSTPRKSSLYRCRQWCILNILRARWSGFAERGYQDEGVSQPWLDLDDDDGEWEWSTSGEAKRRFAFLVSQIQYRGDSGT